MPPKKSARVLAREQRDPHFAKSRVPEEQVHEFRADYDEHGVWFYQAFNDTIADYATTCQKLGGNSFNPSRMTWIKPSFAWVLYRSGYASKHNQTRVLKVKVPHKQLAEILSQCACRHGAGGTVGRVQWDPERDLFFGSDPGKRNKEPRKMIKTRSIQIGVSKQLSELYVASIIAIKDVTDLSRRVGEAHRSEDTKAAMEELRPELPIEKPYMPQCSLDSLVNLCLVAPGALTSESGTAVPDTSENPAGRMGNSIVLQDDSSNAVAATTEHNADAEDGADGTKMSC